MAFRSTGNAVLRAFGVRSLLRSYRLPGPGRLEAEGSYRREAVLLALLLAPVLFGVAVSFLDGEATPADWARGAIVAGLFAVAAYAAGVSDSLAVGPEGVRLRRTSWGRTRERSAPREALEKVRLARRTVGAGRNRRTRYAVELVVDAPSFEEPVRILEAPGETEARRAAERIAKGLGVAFEDALGDVPDARGPDALEGAAFDATTPEGPPPAPIEPAWGSSHELVLRRVEGSGIGPLVFATVLIGLGAAALTGRLGPADAVYGTSAIGLAGLLAARWIYRRASKERIVVTPDAVESRLYFGPLRIARRLVPRDADESLRVQTGSPHRGLAIVTDRVTLVVATGLEPAAIRWLHDWLASRLR